MDLTTIIIIVAANIIGFATGAEIIRLIYSHSLNRKKSVGELNVYLSENEEPYLFLSLPDDMTPIIQNDKVLFDVVKHRVEGSQI